MGLFALLGFSIAFAGSIDWKAELCATQRAFFEQQIKNRLTVEKLGARIKAAAPKVIFVGEYHTDDASESYPWVLEQFRKSLPDLDCLAFEADPKFNPDGVTRKPWRALADFAKKKYLLSYHMVDGGCPEQDSWKDENTKGNQFMRLNTRNRCMAKNLSALFRSGKCQQILMINGTIHLQDNYLDARPSVPRRLRDLGFSTFTVAALDLSRGNDRARQSSLDAWIWPRGPAPGKKWSDAESLQPLCPGVPGAIGENYAFVNSGVELAAKVPFAHVNNEEHGTSGAWSEFDAGLMLSCPVQARDRCEK